MYTSDLYIVFSSLSGVEKRSFSTFLQSPYFNQKQKVIDLWQYLLKNHQYGATAFKKQKVFEVLFLGEAYNDKTMRHLMSWLLKSLEQFLAYSEYKTTPVNETLHLARTYKNRKLGKIFKKTIKTAEKQLSNMRQSEDYFHFNYLLEFEKYEFAESQRRTKENNLSETNAALDKHILISKIKQACLLQSHQSVYKTNYDFSLVNLLLEYIKTSPYKNEPTIGAYYNCYLALTDNNEEAFKELKISIQEKQALFSQLDIRTLFFFAINFCIRQINMGAPAYLREVFDIYRLGVEKDILIQDGILSRFTYNNIVSAGLKLKEFQWLENFIPLNKPKLTPAYRESNFTYNLARLYFTQKNYDKALELLNKVDDRDLLLNLDAKVMLLKLYYELDEYDALSSLLASLKIMLTRKKVLGYHKTHYSNIIKFTNRLLNLKPRDKKAHDKLENDIRTAEVLQEKEWLLEQLALVR